MFKENKRHQQQSLQETENWMKGSVKNKLNESWAPIFYEDVFCEIDERPFSVLYSSSTGAPNAPVNVILSLEILKHMKDLTDIDMMERYRFDYLFNYAVGQRVLGEESISERAIYYFRERVYQYTMEHPEAEDLMFGQFKGLLGNFCKKTGQIMEEQRIDTTMFMSNIKKSGRISLAYDVLMKSVRKIPEGQMSESLREVLDPDFKTNMLYRTKAEQTGSRLDRVFNLCAEALVMLNTLPGEEAANEKRILTRLLEEQTKTDAEGKITAKDNKEISANSLQSAYDEDATYRTKDDVSQSGYVLDITETCSKDNPMQFITDYQVAPNTKADVDIVKERIGDIRATGCEDLYTDGGFYSEEVTEKANESGIAMHYTEMTGGKPTRGISAADFIYNEDNSVIVACPGGHTPIRTGECKSQLTAHFSKDSCAGCPLREQCPGKENKKDVTVRIQKKSVASAVKRREIAEKREENTGKRAGIEGTNSALKQKGLDKLRVRGLAKCKTVCGLKVIAQNVSRFIKYMRGGYDKPLKTKPTPKGFLCPAI